MHREPEVNEVFEFKETNFKCLPCKEFPYPCVHCEASDELCCTGCCLSSKREDKISVFFIRA